MPETLEICPQCQRPNFTKRGLTSHAGNNRCQADAGLLDSLLHTSMDSGEYSLAETHAEHWQIETALQLLNGSDPTKATRLAEVLPLKPLPWRAPAATVAQASEPAVPQASSLPQGEAPFLSPPPSRHALTLADLDAMPAVPVRHATLDDMDPEQLGAMAKGLDLAETQYASLSGTCGALKGLVLMEAKKRLAHGEYLPWLKQHLGKSRKTAGLYTTVAKAFLKCNPRVTFGQLTLALMDGQASLASESLDLTHPMVSAVAKWTAGKTFYQLREEFCAAKGGKIYDRDGTKGARKTLTPEEQLELRRTVTLHAAEQMHLVCEENMYATPRLTPAELDGLIALAETLATKAKAWRKLTKSQRAEALAEFLTQGEATPPSPKKGAKAK